MIVKTAREELIRFKNKAIGLGCFSLLGTLAIVGQAWFFAVLINETFFLGKPLAEVGSTLLCLVGAILVRLVATFSQEEVAQDLASLAKEDLRKRIWSHLMRLGPFTGERHGDVVHLLTDGLENVESYIARYVPQMLYAMMIPLVMAIAIIDAAPWVAIILFITFPLIPFFMILIGRKAEKMNKEQWERMSFLSGHFLDVLQGIVTLKLFGRSEEQIEVIERLSAEFRDSTLRVLRIAFLSALVLELVSTISTALIAVYMGVALLYGHEEFLPAFFVLLLAPEFYAPLRQLGAAFHTGMAGQVSLSKIDDFLALPIQEPASGAKSFSEAESIREVRFKDITYEYPQLPDQIGREQFALKGIDFTLKRGEVTMLVGESGAGKSTIAHLLMRLMAPSSGQILVDTTDLLSVNSDHWRDLVTFVPQQPHLFKGTLRENITFNRPMDEAIVQEALQLVEAQEFIAELPQGLDTVVGEGGVGLSGGQRQRIALARAFLKQAPILVLDEITAHLDVATEQSLAKALKVLMKDRIVLLVGHRLQTMRWADNLLVMREGAIIERGGFDELVRAGGYFSSLVEAGMGRPLTGELLGELATSIDLPSEDTSTKDLSSEGLSTIERSVEEDSVLGLSAEKAFSTGLSVEDESAIELSAEKAPIIDLSVEKESTIDISAVGDSVNVERTGLRSASSNQSGWMQRLFSVLGPARNSLWLSLLFSFLTVFMNVGLLTTSSWLITEAALQPELAALSLAIVGVRFFGIARAVCRYIERYVSHHMAFQGLYGLRVWFYKKLEPLVPAVLNRFTSGEVLGRIMADIETLQFFYLRVIIPPVGAVLLTIIGFYFLAHFSFDLVWLLAAAFVLGAIVIPYGVFLHNRQAIDASLGYRSNVKNTIVESLAGIMDILTYQQEGPVSARVSKEFETLSRAQKTVERGVNIGDTLLLGLTQITMVLGAVIMIPLAHGSQQEGIFIAVVAISLQSYFEALVPLAVAWYHGRESKAAIGRLVALAQEKPAVVDEAQPSGIAPSAVGLEFKDVHFAYPEGRQRVYSDLSLQIKPMEKVALVGPSGSGKTTLLTLLERFYSYDGQIFLGNQELRSIPISEARSYYGSLTQDSYLFHATIEDNIRLAKPQATEQELEEALRFAAIFDWVKSLPNGLKTIIGSGGMGVSGGQKQRIALARLWLRNSPVLLLDEPLEGLDQVVRQEIQESLLKLMAQKTVVCVTHHLGGLEKMDRILFMDQGRIIEDGSYEELMAKGGAFYAYRKLSMETL
ncbi:thiol reductant ABC exporter subunit CydD [uncultured Veillonella sp.]|uniref:thiol reductant ABC exporter subunit CydD n=1 Tax=uncultured Veillonella sp. TaxID=159268 RepID=UPI0025D70497|nr:thiol reductant ABC exporter subunit CydD [uncultured Veillonella sp.]MDY3973424.1 thiol reductant ABC exporter subunit CydD [Veillonella caviae]